MKKNLLVIFSISIFQLAFSQSWEKITGPGYFGVYDVNTLIEYKGTLFAASEGGLYKSNDDGLNWIYSSNGLNDVFSNDLLSITSNSAGIYVSGGAGVYKSTDMGDTWVSANNGLNIQKGESSGIIIAAGDILYYYSGSANKLYSSLDYGSSWSEVFSSNYYYYDSKALGAVGSDFFIVKDDTLYKSSDGSTFNKYIHDGLPYYNGEEYICGYNQELFLISHDTVFYSSNGGSWVDRMNGIPSGISLSSLVYENSKLYLIAGDSSESVYESADNGSTWNEIPTTFPLLEVLSFHSISSGYFALCDNAIYFQASGSSSWVERINGFQLSYGAATVYWDNALFSIQDYTGIKKSVDEGKTWTYFNTGLPLVNGYFIPDDIFYIGRDNLYLPGDSVIFKTNSTLNTWIKVDMPSTLPEGNAFDWVGNIGDTIFISFYNSQNYLYRSKDGGSTWQDIYANTPPGTNNEVESLDGNKNVIIAAQNVSSARFRIIRSFDAGDTWEIASKGIDTTSHSYVDLILSAGNDFYIVQEPENSTQSILYYSSDNGSNWSQAAVANLPSDFIIQDLEYNNGILYATLDDGGVYKSLDKGESWESISGDLPGNVTGTVFFIDTIIYLGTIEHGIYRNPPFKVASVFNSVNNPSSFIAYPNPCNNILTVDINNTSEKITSYKILTIQGEIIKDGGIETSKININVSNLNTGLYFVELDSKNRRYLVKLYKN